MVSPSLEKTRHHKTQKLKHTHNKYLFPTQTRIGHSSDYFNGNENADVFRFGPSRCLVFQERNENTRMGLKVKLCGCPAQHGTRKQVKASKQGLQGVGMETDASSFAAYLRVTFPRRSQSRRVRRVRASASARGLGRALALAPFVVREQQLVDDPAHPRPPVALVQAGLRGILQHLQHRTGRLGTVGTSLEDPGGEHLLPEVPPMRQ